MDKKNAKDMICRGNKFQKTRDEWNEDKMKRPDLSIKICVKRMKQHMLFTTTLSK